MLVDMFGLFRDTTTERSARTLKIPQLLPKPSGVPYGGIRPVRLLLVSGIEDLT
jgi:hypothetical protein